MQNTRLKNVYRVVFIQLGVTSYRYKLYQLLSEFYGDSFVLFHNNLNLGFRPENEPWSSQMRGVKKIGPFIFQNIIKSITFKSSDIVFISGDPRIASNYFIIFLSKIVGFKVIWWSQFRSPTTNSGLLLIRMAIASLCDGICFYTDNEKQLARNEFNFLNRKKIFSINNSIDISYIEGHRVKYNALIRSKNILFIGRLTKKANFELLIQSIIENPGLEDFHFHVIGDFDTYKNYKAIVCQKNIANLFTFYGPVFDQKLISEVSNQCVMSLYTGSIGLSLLHSMAYGIPTIVHNNFEKHMPEIITLIESKAGIYFEYGSAQSLAECLMKNIKKSTDLNELSGKVQTIVDEKYNIRHTAINFQKIIDYFAKEKVL
jgi:glycosyltransferase involved in cell wall biosynthesis